MADRCRVPKLRKLDCDRCDAVVRTEIIRFQRIIFIRWQHFSFLVLPVYVYFFNFDNVISSVAAVKAEMYCDSILLF